MIVHSMGTISKNISEILLYNNIVLRYHFKTNIQHIIYIIHIYNHLYNTYVLYILKTFKEFIYKETNNMHRVKKISTAKLSSKNYFLNI